MGGWDWSPGGLFGPLEASESGEGGEEAGFSV